MRRKPQHFDRDPVQRVVSSSFGRSGDGLDEAVDPAINNLKAVGNGCSHGVDADLSCEAAISRRKLTDAGRSFARVHALGDHFGEPTCGPVQSGFVPPRGDDGE